MRVSGNSRVSSFHSTRMRTRTPQQIERAHWAGVQARSAWPSRVLCCPEQAPLCDTLRIARGGSGLALTLQLSEVRVCEGGMRARSAAPNRLHCQICVTLKLTHDQEIQHVRA